MGKTDELRQLVLEGPRAALEGYSVDVVRIYVGRGPPFIDENFRTNQPVGLAAGPYTIGPNWRVSGALRLTPMKRASLASVRLG
jgi:hypothetical protein